MSILDLPTLVGTALGLTGQTAIDTGGLILSIAIITMVGLAMSVTKVDVLGTTIVLFALTGVLTAIGWLSPWLIVVAIIVFSVLFGSKVMVWLQGRSA